MVFDSLSDMRLLAQSPLRYQRQILALKQFFVGRECTVLLVDNRTARDRICSYIASLTGSSLLTPSLLRIDEYGARFRCLSFAVAILPVDTTTL